MKSIWLRLRRWWCRSMHPDPMWPVHGYYYCPRCGLAHPVAWETGAPEAKLPLR